MSPRNVGLRHLAALLEATATTFEAIAEERNIDPLRLSLTRVKGGSAAYQLASEDQQAPRAFSSFVKVVRQRGKNASPRTRQSLTRLHVAAVKAGAGLRVDPSDKVKTDEPIMLAPPLPDDAPRVEEGTVVFARVVGIRLDTRERATVTLRYDDGGSGEFEAGPELVERAAHLIGRHVEARVTFLRGESRNFDGEVEQLEERPPAGDLMDAIVAARKQLDDRGIIVDAEAWLAEESDDERPHRGD